MLGYSYGMETETSQWLSIDLSLPISYENVKDSLRSITLMAISSTMTYLISSGAHVYKTCNIFISTYGSMSRWSFWEVCCVDQFRLDTTMETR